MERFLDSRVTNPGPKYLFYGRRKGKPLRAQHQALMQNLLPQVSVDLENPLTGSGPRRVLEIGFGGGEHLAHQAALNPELSYIGAEPFLNGVAKLLAEIEARAVTNLKVHYGDARPLLEQLPPESFERIYLLYPDPWPKERQKKRRFVNQANLAHFARILKPKGEFLFASDIEDYVGWTREHVTESKLFTETGDDRQPYKDWIQTRYEAKARREGRSSHYLTFVVNTPQA
ncbi:tRNA (guanosine(46)-N7)-methyltransferase TrmB [Aestuariivirga litoralis]|uniref:tRNA (guanosine(46)-N7)-methyltransferase TrmB n=1 Tax=Aestuariivirga litoralis TaxID=2650924 RepID=UPI0018C55215|nr:tRNA (guanosine(46)-N7)-methyltransferase TrmB [Aestuariivirga litoralis]